MQTTSKQIIEAERVMENLSNLTHSFTSRNLICKLAQEMSCASSGYGKDILKNDEFIKSQAADLVRLEPLKIKAVSLEYFLWFAYTMPLGKLHEYTEAFASHNLDPLLQVYETMFKRIVLEAGISERRSEEHVDSMMKTVYRVEEYNKAYCKKRNIKRIALKNGLYNFYLEQKESPVFSRLCLGCCANINAVLKPKIVRKIKKLQTKPAKIAAALADIEADFKKNNKPGCDVHDEFHNAVAISRKILVSAKKAEAYYDVNIKEFIRKDIKALCVRRKYEPDTIDDEIKWTNDFFSAAENHKTIWISVKPGEKTIDRLLIERSLNDVAGDDASDAEKDLIRAMVCGGHNYGDIIEGMPPGTSVEEFKEKYIEKMIRENYNLHHAAGGLIRMTYCWENRRVIMPDKLALFLSHILEMKKDDPDYEFVFRIFIESLLTGTSYKNILLGRLACDNEPGAPEGIYFSAEELAGNAKIDKNDIETKCKAAIADFKEKYMTRKFSEPDLVYTSRSWATDKTKYLTLVEQSLVCGNVVPGTRADLFYVMPTQLIESFHKSADSFLGRQIEYLEFCRKSGNGLNKEKVSALLPRIIEARTELKSKLSERRKLWDANRPRITFTDEDNIVLLKARVFDGIGKRDEFSVEYYTRIETAMMFLIMAVLCLREQEAKEIRIRDVSRIGSSLTVIGKSNIAHFESRILSINEEIKRLFDSFIRLRKRVVRLIPKADRKGFDTENMFLYAKNAATELGKHVKETTGNPDADADSIRKYAVSYLHNCLVKSGKSSYEDYQAQIGHIYAPGFEKLGPFNYTDFSNYSLILREMAASFEKEIESLTKIMEALWR